jgi:hypothetical protein
MVSAMGRALFDELPEQAAPAGSGGARPRLRTAERRQVESRAVSLDDLAAADHRVRLMWRFVEGLDLSPLHAGIKAVAAWHALAHNMACSWRLAPA